jgi:glutathione S-transferase
MLTRMTHTIRLHRHPVSGHCHRVELLLSMLNLPFERVEVDLLRGEHTQAPFLAKNKLAQVPVIEDGDVVLSDSNAILVYLALRYDASRQWLPSEPLAAAEVQRWFSLAAGELVRGPGLLRLAALFKTQVDRSQAERAAGQLLTLLDTTLRERAFLLGELPTLADLAQYAYTVLAPEGGVSLEPYPALRAWHARVEALPRFVPMLRSQTAPAVAQAGAA